MDRFRESPRGAGFVFGESAVNQFTETNGLELICRAHQMVQQGFQYMFSRSNLVTVWSAPNYCYRCENVASVLMLDANLNRTFKVFREVREGGKVSCRIRTSRQRRVDLVTSCSLAFSDIRLFALFVWKCRNGKAFMGGQKEHLTYLTLLHFHLSESAYKLSL